MRASERAWRVVQCYDGSGATLDRRRLCEAVEAQGGSLGLWARPGATLGRAGAVLTEVGPSLGAVVGATHRGAVRTQAPARRRRIGGARSTAWSAGNGRRELPPDTHELDPGSVWRRLRVGLGLGLGSVSGRSGIEPCADLASMQGLPPEVI